MNNPIRWPLHYQILVAMILGAVAGLFVNPGERELDDARILITDDDAKVVVSMQFPDGEEYREEFADVVALKKRFPELAEQMTAGEGETVKTRSVTIPVTQRRVYLSEDGEKITLRYVRQHDGKKAVSSYEATSFDRLVAENPEWAPERKTALGWYEGHFVRHVSVWSKFVGDLFLRLLRMITIPLIVTSLVVGVAGLGQTSRLGSMFGKTLLYYATTSFLAITTGILMVNLIQPGRGVDLPGGGKAVGPAGEQSLGGVFTNLINSMIPPNPIQSLAQAEFLSIITFSILFGLFIIRVGGRSSEVMRGLFQAAFDVIMSMTQAVIRLAPIGVLAFMLYATATQGLDVFRIFAWYMVTVFLALAFHAVVILPLILWFVAKQSPWQYAKAMTPALLTAFSTASSNGTLPLTLTCVEERAGVPNRVSSFVLPLGATINMDGTALYEAVAAIFIAQAIGADLTLTQQAIVAVTATLAAIGAAGIPEAGLVTMLIVLNAVNLPVEYVGLILSVDWLLDRFRTAVNTFGDSVGAAVVERALPGDSLDGQHR